MTGDNRLPVLAAEIRKAHADVQDAAKTAAERAIDAGHALIEAKALVKHGQWLPWLREHCALAERTAQLYMRIAKSGNPAEMIAAIGLEGAAAEIQTFVTPGYSPFAHCDEQGEQEWQIYSLFLSQVCGWHPEGSSYHCEYLCQKQFKSPDDWLAGEGPGWRKQLQLREPDENFIKAWHAFLDENRHLTTEDAHAALAAIQKRVGPMPMDPPARRRKARKRKFKSATVADLDGAS